MLITQEQLVEATGYSRPADIRKCLKRQGIRTFKGRDGRVFAFAADFEKTKQRRREPNFAALAG